MTVDGNEEDVWVGRLRGLLRRERHSYHGRVWGSGDHFLSVCVPGCIQGNVCVGTHAHVCGVRAHVWRSEVNLGYRPPLFFKHVLIVCACARGVCCGVEVSGQLRKSFPSFHHAGPRD